ncbi:MAG: hypothetical protein KatS3mg110_3822 [Pirellulaceae bacterium]|nr:MAG: hypothetical protein KatS3mg110_3822 [Pirellulaceae bacterium]
MELDRTFVAIRERSGSELLDLALLVCRRHGLGLLAIAAPAVACFMAVNTVTYLLWFPEQLQPTPGDSGDWRFLCELTSLTMLILVEAPLALAGVTAFLGKAVFMERPLVRLVTKELWETATSLLYFQGIRRFSLLMPVLAVFTVLRVDETERESWWWLGWVILVVVLFVRSMRPFLIELIVLERAPRKARRSADVPLAQRSQQLHRAQEDWLGRAVSNGVVAVVLAMMGVGTMQFLIGPLVHLLPAAVGQLVELIGIQTALWTVAVYMTAHRFLTYLDLRIRHEGWEVELLLRAEAARWEAAE